MLPAVTLEYTNTPAAGPYALNRLLRRGPGMPVLVDAGQMAGIWYQALKTGAVFLPPPLSSL